MYESISQGMPALFEAFWGFFQIPFPGLNFTVGQVSIGFFCIHLSVRLFQAFFGTGSGSFGYRSGSTNNPKISERRRKDEK